MAEVITKEELQKEIHDEIKQLLVESAQIVKQYVDEHSIDNPAKRDELKTEIANYIAQKYDFEAEKAKLEEASKVAEALLKVFDENSDGSLDVKEVIEKLSAVADNTKKIEDIEKEISGISTTIDAIQKLVGDKIAELKGYVEAVKADLAKTDATVREVEARLNTQYFTKEEIKVALTINKDDIVVDVRKIFFPESDNGNAQAANGGNAQGIKPGTGSAHNDAQANKPANGGNTQANKPADNGKDTDANKPANGGNAQANKPADNKDKNTQTSAKSDGGVA